MPTSEERCEVAARLRDAKRKCESRGYPWMCDDLCLAIGYEHDYEADNGIFDRLADLIDPTCHNADDGVRGGFVCSECSYHVEQDTMDADFNAWEDLRHCPHCGARVTSGGER